MERNICLYNEARRLRAEEEMSLDEITSRLGVKRTTAYGWIRDIPLQRIPDRKAHALVASKAMSEKYSRLRTDAYTQAANEAEQRMKDKLFRDFVVLYLAEGYRKTRFRLAVANTDPDILILAYRFMRELSSKTFCFHLLCHREVDRPAAIMFWANALGIEPTRIQVFGKSARASVRKIAAAVHGVMSIRVNDACAREKMQAFLDWLKHEWTQ